MPPPAAGQKCEDGRANCYTRFSKGAFGRCAAWLRSTSIRVLHDFWDVIVWSLVQTDRGKNNERQ